MDEEEEMLPDQLSGDENVERDMLMVDITQSSATKASIKCLMYISS